MVSFYSPGWSAIQVYWPQMSDTTLRLHDFKTFSVSCIKEIHQRYFQECEGEVPLAASLTRQWDFDIKDRINVADICDKSDVKVFNF